MLLKVQLKNSEMFILFLEETLILKIWGKNQFILDFESKSTFFLLYIIDYLLFNKHEKKMKKKAN